MHISWVFLKGSFRTAQPALFSIPPSTLSCVESADNPVHVGKKINTLTCTNVISFRQYSPADIHEIE